MPHDLQAPAAALDLGSNSFHLIVAREDGGTLRIVDRHRERVALGEGLGPDGSIDDATRARALSCLARMAQRLRDVPPGRVRAVGTNALRQVPPEDPFLHDAEATLGHPIDVIAGREEARLIYLGVSHDVEDEGECRLVIDIGGGSTECIVGEGYDVVAADSLHMGCVSWTLRHLRGKPLSRETMKEAILAARVEFEPIERRTMSLGFRRVIGASGTITAVSDVLRALDWTDGSINAKALRKLEKRWISLGGATQSFPGLPEDRAPVFAGGLAILSAAFEAFEIETMGVSGAGLREGVVHDLLGRIRHDDVRDRTVRQQGARFNVDEEQARRVERTALQLLASLARAWDLRDPDWARAISWASRLHEVGFAIGYSGHHKHGAYITTHADLPGFSRQDQALLSTLILCHRRRLSRERLQSIPEEARDLVFRLCIVLRLAVLLNRGRAEARVPKVSATVRGAVLRLSFPPEWLGAHPLTQEDLRLEAAILEGHGIELRWR